METILVVDDEGAIVEVLCLVLADAGYRVRSAPHGQAALAGLEQAPVDLVLSDVMMPQLDGPALCARMQADPRLRGIPVVLMSATPSASQLDGCAYAALLVKPFVLEDVLRTVAAALRARPAGVAPPHEG